MTVSLPASSSSARSWVRRISLARAAAAAWRVYPAATLPVRTKLKLLGNRLQHFAHGREKLVNLGLLDDQRGRERDGVAGDPHVGALLEGLQVGIHAARGRRARPG